jgi:alpha-tubulin suppressor-like RCC1 family protein
MHRVRLVWIAAAAAFGVSAVACSAFKDDLPDVACDGLACGPASDHGDAGLDSTVPTSAGDDGGFTSINLDANGADADASPAESQPPPDAAQQADADATDALVPIGLALGDSHSCALLSDHTVRCWGSNQSGQLGLPDAAMDGSYEPVQVPGVDHVVAIRSSPFAEHTCAILDDGGLTCWGNNAQQEIQASPTEIVQPTHVTGVPAVNDVTPGAYHTCAAQADASAPPLCWGYWIDGPSYPPGPTPILGLANVSAVASGTWFSCARTNDEKAWCWGTNEQRALGLSDTSIRSLNAVVQSVTAVAQVAVGGGNTVCARSTDGGLSCWGENRAGQTGVEWKSTDDDAGFPTPVHVEGVASAAEVIVAGIHACARLENGTLACWGSNWEGRAGFKDWVDVLVPTVVPDLKGVTAVAAGDAHMCAILDGTRVVCWGRDDNGQLGNGGGTTNVPQPVNLR